MSSLQRTIGRNAYRNQPGFTEWKHARKVQRREYIKAGRAKKLAELAKKKLSTPSIVKTGNCYVKTTLWSRIKNFIKKIFNGRRKESEAR